MRPVDRDPGFTMIELLFVIVVIGVMLAVITPRAYRANIDAKYGVVRQGAVELTSYALDWANQGLASQDLGASTADLNAYMASLVGSDGTAPVPSTGEATWIAEAAASNWKKTAAPLVIPGRNTAAGVVPEITIQEMIPAVKIPVNPFNGVNVFAAANDPSPVGGHAITGAIACAGINEDNTGATTEWYYYALIFQGTDSTTAGPALGATYYAGQDPTALEGLRNGIFLARER